jgi:glyoxylase-like metal-dependent hydrolase (beta-lactamase superfamily II)
MSDTQTRAVPHSLGCTCGTRGATLSADGAWLTPRQVFAASRHIVETIRAAAAKATITVHRLRGQVSVLEGSGGNVAVLVAPDGKLLVDAGIGVSQPMMAEALATLGDAPIRQLINTHWHFDHSDGNAWVNAAGASILAHENTRTRLSSAQHVEDWHTDFPAPPAGALPSDVFTTERSVDFGGTAIALKYYGPAHTDGDISATFGEADILHTGDTFWNGIYPFIDYSTGGNIDGSIRAVEENLAMTRDSTIIIPGHGPIGNRAQLADYRDMLVAIRENVATLKRQGRSLDDIVAAKPTAAFDAKWGQFVIDPIFFTELVHEGV